MTTKYTEFQFLELAIHQLSKGEVFVNNHAYLHWIVANTDAIINRSIALHQQLDATSEPNTTHSFRASEHLEEQKNKST